jgi:hypothetical protein
VMIYLNDVSDENGGATNFLEKKDVKLESYISSSSPVCLVIVRLLRGKEREERCGRGRGKEGRKGEVKNI